MGSELTLTNYEMEYIITVIKSSENRILLKKVIKQKGGFLGNAFGPLMKVSLPLMKNILNY